MIYERRFSWQRSFLLASFVLQKGKKVFFILNIFLDLKWMMLMIMMRRGRCVDCYTFCRGSHGFLVKVLQCLSLFLPYEVWLLSFFKWIIFQESKDTIFLKLCHGVVGKIKQAMTLKKDWIFEQIQVCYFVLHLHGYKNYDFMILWYVISYYIVYIGLCITKLTRTPVIKQDH